MTASPPPASASDEPTALPASDEPTALPAEQDWFVHSFDEDYSLLYRHRDTASARREVQALMAGLQLPAGSRVLDVCCGAGRHMITLHRMGYAVWGVDLSANLLIEAAGHAELAGRLVRADVRALPFAPVFDAAVNLFTSFGYFLRDEENAGAMRQITGVLRPGGLLVMDLIHRAYLKNHLVRQTREQRDGLTLTAHRRLIENRVVKRTVIESQGRTRERIESVRLYRPDELVELLGAAGMTDIRLAGDFDLSPLSEDSPRMIAVGRRA